MVSMNPRCSACASSPVDGGLEDVLGLRDQLRRLRAEAGHRERQGRRQESDGEDADGHPCESGRALGHHSLRVASRSIAPAGANPCRRAPPSMPPAPGEDGVRSQGSLSSETVSKNGMAAGCRLPLYCERRMMRKRCLYALLVGALIGCGTIAAQSVTPVRDSCEQGQRWLIWDKPQVLSNVDQLRLRPAGYTGVVSVG